MNAAGLEKLGENEMVVLNITKDSSNGNQICSIFVKNPRKNLQKLELQHSIVLGSMYRLSTKGWFPARRQCIRYFL